MPTPEQIAQHYELEKKLAARIMNASPDDRTRASIDAYDELFSTITWHDGHLKTVERRDKVRDSYKPFLRMVGRDQDVLELGCGNGAQMRALGPLNRRCVGIDISETVLDNQAVMPSNVELRVADATNLFLLEDDSFDVAFSTQLVEHIHPEDVQRHFDEVARVLRPGGRYICETPHPLTGPHDVSFHFDETATCFHLKEYTFAEILTLMRRAGFRSFRAPLFRQAMYEKRPWLAKLGELPADWRRPVESAVRWLPIGSRRRIARMLRLSSVFVEARI